MSQASSPWTTSLAKSSVNRSRTTLRVRSGSPYSSCGDLPPLTFSSMSAHRAVSRSTSRVSSSSEAPSAAVRTMTPAVSGTISLSSVLRRLRSVSGSLREMPRGVAVRARRPGTGPGRLTWPVSRAPLWPTGSLVTCTRTVWPGGQHRLDLALLAVLVPDRRPVDLTGVEHGVAALADVDEGRLHRGQHVLHATEVDVADQRGLRLAGDVVLDEDLVLEHGDLGQVVALPDRP